MEKENRRAAIEPETSPLYPASVYTFPSLDAVAEFYGDNSEGRYLYRRNGHPNQRIIESRLATLESAEAAMVCSSGTSAITQACFSHLQPGKQVLSTKYLYGGTHAFFENILRPWGVDIVYLDLNDLDALNAALTPATGLIYAESIANPLLQVLDLQAIGKFAQSHSIPLFVDNTFATPWLVKPLEYGATLSIHSLTKYLNGHSDVIAGAVMGSREAVDKVERFAVTFGGTLAPFDAWLTERGLQTFHLRYPAQCANAQQVADFLAAHPQVGKVFYPGLTEHPDHGIAQRILQGGFGAMVSFEVVGGYAAANTVVQALEHIDFAPSLGGIRTTVSHPGLTSHRSYSAEERAELGIADGLLRMSVGAEPIEEILDDLGRGLDAVRK